MIITDPGKFFTVLCLIGAALLIAEKYLGLWLYGKGVT